MLAASSRQLPAAGGSLPQPGGGQQRRSWAAPAACPSRRRQLVVQATTQSKQASSRQRSRGALSAMGGKAPTVRSFLPADWARFAGCCFLWLPPADLAADLAAASHPPQYAIDHHPSLPLPAHLRHCPFAPLHPHPPLVLQCCRPRRSSSRSGRRSVGSLMSCRACLLCGAPQTCLS